MDLCGLCTNGLATCADCGDDFCPDHIHECDTCGLAICDNCDVDHEADHEADADAADDDEEGEDDDL